MSDTEDNKKSGYRLEYAPSSRGKCKGPKPCNGTKLEKGEFRLGSVVDFKGNTSFAWRHWGCVTPKIIVNMKNTFEEPDELDGFEDLTEEDQERVRNAWEAGKVADEDIPESARKPAEDEDEDEGSGKEPKKRAAAKAKKDGANGAPVKGVFKLEYASSGRAKCKVCGQNVGKDYFRLGNEINLRGTKSFAWRHWGCTDAKMIDSMKASYGNPSTIDGFVDLRSDEQAKVHRAWDEGAVPEDDRGVGEAVPTGKKAPVRRKKAAEGDGVDDEEKPKTRARGAKKGEDEDGEKPKKRPSAKAKNSTEKEKAKGTSRKRPAAKKSEDEESGEDFEDEIADVDEEEEEEEELVPRKRKRAPASKASASKPPSKRAKPAPSHPKKKPAEIVEESDLDDDE